MYKDIDKFEDGYKGTHISNVKPLVALIGGCALLVFMLWAGSILGALVDCVAYVY